ncbi:retrovirus-related pol polyprotein from transposon TNT 1-94 [Tanacetum coccineum]
MLIDHRCDYTSNSNTIPYDQYMEDNEDHVVQRDVSSVRNDALMSILDEMHKQGVQSRLANKPNMVVNDLVTSKLARYKELVGGSRTGHAWRIWTSGCPKHMTGNRYKAHEFCGKVIVVSQIQKHTCFVRNIKGTDILKGSRSTNLYTISIDEMMKSSLICLLSKASKSKSWLWHRRLNHLNFGTINDLARKDLVRGLPRLKFERRSSLLSLSTWKKQNSPINQNLKNTIWKFCIPLQDLCGPNEVQIIKGRNTS